MDKRIILLIVIPIILMGTVSAYVGISYQNLSDDLTASGAFGNSGGMKFTANRSVELINVTVDSQATWTILMLQNADRTTNLTIGTRSGQNVPLGYNLTEGTTYWLVTDPNGQNQYGAGTFPLNSGYVTWIKGLNPTNGAEDTDSYYGFLGITVGISDFIEHTILRNLTGYEMFRESYFFNLTTNGTLPTNTFLLYNETRYNSTLTNPSGNYYQLNNTLLLNGSFLGLNTIVFNFTLGNKEYSSVSSNQRVNQTLFGICNSSVTVPFLNFTFIDEKTVTNISASLGTSYFTFYGDDINTNKTMQITNSTELQSHSFCVTPADRTIYLSSDLRYYATSYPQRIWEQDFTSYSNATTNYTLYLLSSSDGLYVTFQVLSPQGQTISGVSVNATTVLGGTTTLVATGTTDDAGTVTFWLNPESSHTFTFVKSGYDTLTQTITPTQSIYTVTLGGGSSQATVLDYTEGINIFINPTESYLINNTAYNINYTISTNNWLFDEWGYHLFYGNGSLIDSQSSVVDTGGTLNTDINTLNSTRIVMEYYYVVNSTYLNFTRYWIVSKTNPFSISHFFTEFSTYINANLFGILSDDNGDFGKALISVLILVLVTGTLSYRYGIRSEPVIFGIIFGLILFLDSVSLIPSFTLVNNTIDLGKVLIYLTGLVLIGFMIKEEYR